MRKTKLYTCMMLAFGGTLGLPAVAQQTLDRVEITGSLIKRVENSTALPVQTISRDDIQKQGIQTVEQLLTYVTANSAVGANTTAQGAGSATYGQSAASLRGLGQSRTLVLVNGRRIANYATDGTAPDINVIPLSAIDRVEILKDGASAIYGSDAIAGVINFILRKSFQGVEASGYYGKSTQAGGAVSKAGLVVGFGNLDTDRYNIVGSVDIGHDSAIYGAQRKYSQNSWINNGNYDQSATPSGALRSFDPTVVPNAQGVIPNTLNSQGKARGNPLAPDNCAQNGSAFDENLDTCRFNSSPYVPLVPDVKRQNVSGSFRFKLNDQAEFFLEGFYAHNVTVISEQFSPFSVSFFATDKAFAAKNIYPAIILSPTSPFYPTAFLATTPSAGKPVTVSLRNFDSGGRIHTDTADQGHVVGGIRGNFKDYDYDVAYSHNTSSVSESTQRGYSSQTAIASLLSNNNAFNPFTQYQAPALAAQMAGTNYVGPMIDSTYTTDAFDARASGTLYPLPAGPLAFALGTSLRNEHMAFNPSAAFQSGDISGYGGQALPLTTSRNSKSVFTELNAPILKNLEVNAALRYDKYPNASSTTPKLGLRFQPISQVLLRASYGKGFREPSLPELFNPQTAATTATFVDPVTKTTGQYTQLVGGNPTLGPEKSTQKSIGFVVDASRDLSVSLDYFDIKVKNLVTTLGAQFIVQQAAAGNPTYTGLVARDPLGNITQINNTNINSGSLATRGFDLDVKWRIANFAEYGTFSAYLNSTYLTKYSETLADGTVQPSLAKTVDGDGNALTAVEAGGIVFRWRNEATLDWQYGGFGTSVTGHYQSGYDDNIPCCTPQTTPLRIGSFTTWDLQGRYTGVKNLTLRLGVKNIFNRAPPGTVTLGQYFQTGYDPTYYDPHGRFVYLTAGYKF